MLGAVLLGIFLQLPTADTSRDVRLNGRLYAVVIPYGWKWENLRFGNDILLEHSSGASLTFRTAAARGMRDLDAIARQGVDRVMQPLGFATFGPPLNRKVAGSPAIQYEIRGNRLSERRKLLYIAVQRDDGFYELIYENNELRFDALLTEAERIGGSVELSSVARERMIVGRIRTIHTAEALYQRNHNRYGTIADLAKDKLIDENFETASEDYRVNVILSGNGYQVAATPVAGSSGRWAFESRQDGVIRYSSRIGLAPRGMAGRPIQ